MKLVRLGVSALAVAVMAVSLPAAAGAAANDKGADGDRTICKRISETGSLVKKRKVCRTKAEWEMIRRAQRAAMEEGRTSGGTNSN